MIKRVTIFIFFFLLIVKSYTQPLDFENPVLSGFNPDPSVCRVGEDYYMVTSSFVTYPGIPVYHSKDLVNWSLIGYGINRPGLVGFDGLKDENGIWAVTIRHHDGLFYLITNCNKCGGNFYITSSSPQGPWSDPVWLKDATGIDPSLFWDDDGKCYYTGNDWSFKKSWPGQVALWIQELDLKQQKLVGEKKILSYGYANNAAYTEGPHIYKINNKYLLLASEGGTDQYHAITAHHSNAVLGPYVSDKINPVLSHRHLGVKYPVQAVGHADLVQTQNGEWWAVVLGKRLLNGAAPLTRETFLCKVEFEDGTPIFNPGFGTVLLKQKRPQLPWAPVQQNLFKDEFEQTSLALRWQHIRIPGKQFYQLLKGQLVVDLRPEVADSFVNSSMIVQRIKHFSFSAATKMIYKTSKQGEQAGLIIYRGSENYYALLKDKSDIVLIRMQNGKKEVIAKLPYTGAEVFFSVTVNNSDVIFSYGETAHSMKQIGSNQSIAMISESTINRFNGPVAGMYATSNGAETKTKAFFEWFEYKATE